ncbi:MAG: DMT family transporter [Candidatus Eisenbacteria bacterium]
MPYLGETLALAAPITWSFAVIVFRRTGRDVPPLALNLFKITFAFGLLLVTWYLLDRTGAAAATQPHSGKILMLLLASGVIGIGIADTLFLMALNRIGAGLHAIVTTSYSPSIIALSVLYLGERLSMVQGLGVVAILTAVLSVTAMRGPHRELDRRTLALGTILGISAMVAQAISVVMVKPVLDQMSVVWANCWRMAGGIGSLLLLLPILPREQRAGLRSLRRWSLWPAMILGSLLGNYVSLMLWLGGMKYTQASVASALNQTSTLWTFLLAALLLREPVTWKRTVGLAVGLLGVALVTFG